MKIHTMKWQKTSGPVSASLATLLREPARVGAAFVKDPARRQRAPIQRAMEKNDMMSRRSGLDESGVCKE